MPRLLLRALKTKPGLKDVTVTPLCRHGVIGVHNEIIYIHSVPDYRYHRLFGRTISVGEQSINKPASVPSSWLAVCIPTSLWQKSGDQIAILITSLHFNYHQGSWIRHTAGSEPLSQKQLAISQVKSNVLSKHGLYDILLWALSSEIGLASGKNVHVITSSGNLMTLLYVWKW